jgi:hypothetical protein
MAFTPALPKKEKVVSEKLITIITTCNATLSPLPIFYESPDGVLSCSLQSGDSETR